MATPTMVSPTAAARQNRQPRDGPWWRCTRSTNAFASRKVIGTSVTPAARSRGATRARSRRARDAGAGWAGRTADRPGASSRDVRVDGVDGGHIGRVADVPLEPIRVVPGHLSERVVGEPDRAWLQRLHDAEVDVLHLGGRRRPEAVRRIAMEAEEEEFLRARAVRCGRQ